MSNECPKCNSKIPNDLKKCPFCGAKLNAIKEKSYYSKKESDIKKVKKEKETLIVFIKYCFLTIFIIYVGLMIALVSYTNNNSKSKKNSVETVKTYKTNSKEYRDYLKSILKNIANDNKDWFSSCDTFANGCTYFKLTCYANKHYDEEVFKAKVEEIQKYVASELRKNNYESGYIFTCNYDIVQLNLYNRTKDGRFYPDYFLDYHMDDYY